jgi:hypothetical protein
MMFKLTSLRTPDGIYGGEQILWYEFRDVLGILIDQHGIPPVDPVFLPQRGQPVANVIRPWPCGGIKGLHFHYGDKVYPVTAQLWNEFTSAVIERCRVNLDMAETVMERTPLSLGTVVTLSETATVFPPMEGKEFV